MAMVITALHHFPPGGGEGKDVLVLIEGDDNYLQGGTAFTAAQLAALGLNDILAVFPSEPYTAVTGAPVDRTYLWHRTNKKLIAQVPSTGLQAGNADYNTDRIVAKVYGL